MLNYYSDLATRFPYSITTQYLKTDVYDPEDSEPFIIMLKDKSFHQAYSHVFKLLQRKVNNYYKICSPQATLNTKLAHSTYVMWENNKGEKDLLYQIDTCLYPSMDLMLELDRHAKIIPDLDYQLVVRYLISYKNPDDSNTIKIRLIPCQLKFKLNYPVFNFKEFELKNPERIKKIIQNKQDYVFDFSELIFDKEIIYDIFVEFVFYKIKFEE